MSEKENGPRVDSTLSKGLQILEALSDSETGRGVSEISRELGLTKSNTFRLLQSLTALGYVQQKPDKTYSASLKAWQIGRKVIDRMNLRELCAEEMQYLAKESGETIYLAVLDGNSVIYIDKRESIKPIRSWNPIGGSAPLHCVGTGKAFLAASYEKLRENLKGELVGYTEKSLTNIKALDEDIAATKARGYAFDRGEFREGILSFGAAITLPDGEPIAALGISVPEVNMPADGELQFGTLVANTAAKISKKMLAH